MMDQFFFVNQRWWVIPYRCVAIKLCRSNSPVASEVSFSISFPKSPLCPPELAFKQCLHYSWSRKCMIVDMKYAWSPDALTHHTQRWKGSNCFMFVLRCKISVCACPCVFLFMICIEDQNKHYTSNVGTLFCLVLTTSKVCLRVKAWIKG